MHVRLQQLLIWQIMHNCEFGLIAATDGGAELLKGPGANIYRVFYSMQGLLTASANISKALWGSGGKKAAERQPLRSRLRVPDDSPLKAVTVRNGFEHYDERLERWVTRDRRWFADMNIGPTAELRQRGDASDCFRALDPETKEVTFWGETFNVSEIVTALGVLKGHAAREFSFFEIPPGTA